jgi:branched-chain amino acid transport system substrate-binding protein
MTRAACPHWAMGSLAAATFSIALGLTSTAAPAAESFKIGLIASYTGAFATWGPQFQNAIEAFQAINGKTVKGPKGEDISVDLVYRDAASGGADKAKQLGEELILRERVKMLTGFELSPHAMAVGDIATQAKTPVVIMNAATASIVRGSPYYVRTSVTIVSDYAPGLDAETYFHKAFKAGGGQIVGSARTPQQETNFAVYMEKAMQAKPDAIYMFQPGGSPSISFVKAYVERGLKQAGIKLLGNGEFAELYLPHFSDDVIGVVSVNHYTETNKLPENIIMRDQLHKMFGDKGVTDIASVAAWDGMNLIYTALREAGASAEGLKYIDAMKGKTLRSPRGEIMIDPQERDIVENIYIRRIEKVGGQLQNVDIFTFPMVKDPWKIDNPPKS